MKSWPQTDLHVTDHTFMQTKINLRKVGPCTVFKFTCTNSFLVFQCFSIALNSYFEVSFNSMTSLNSPNLCHLAPLKSKTNKQKKKGLKARKQEALTSELEAGNEFHLENSP